MTSKAIERCDVNAEVEDVVQDFWFRYVRRSKPLLGVFTKTRHINNPHHYGSRSWKEIMKHRMELHNAEVMRNKDDDDSDLIIDDTDQDVNKKPSDAMSEYTAIGEEAESLRKFDWRKNVRMSEVDVVSIDSCVGLFVLTTRAFPVIKAVRTV